MRVDQNNKWGPKPFWLKLACAGISPFIMSRQPSEGSSPADESRATTPLGRSQSRDVSPAPVRNNFRRSDADTEAFAPDCAGCKKPCKDPENRARTANGQYMHKAPCASGKSWFEKHMRKLGDGKALDEMKKKHGKRYEYMVMDLVENMSNSGSDKKKKVQMNVLMQQSWSKLSSASRVRSNRQYSCCSGIVRSFVGIVGSMGFRKPTHRKSGTPIAKNQRYCRGLSGASSKLQLKATLASSLRWERILKQSRTRKKSHAMTAMWQVLLGIIVMRIRNL